MKLVVSRSQSPAAKARQKQIDRENLILIKKLVALDNNSHASNKPSKPKRTHTSTIKQVQVASVINRNTIVVPAQRHSSCLQQLNKPLPDVPPAACHLLYTHHSATMRNNFADLNGSTMHKSSNTRRTQVQILDENKKLLQRILSARKSYSRTQWSEQERERRTLLRNISRHQQAASTSRLPSYNAPDCGTSSESRIGTGRGSLRRHNSSSDELVISTEAVGIRVLPTTHLVKVPTPKQRPQSASATTRSSSTGSTSIPTGGRDNTNVGWSCLADDRQSVASNRKPVSESIVQRMRSMTLERHEDEFQSAAGTDEEEADSETDGEDDEEDGPKALLRDQS